MFQLLVQLLTEKGESGLETHYSLLTIPVDKLINIYPRRINSTINAKYHTITNYEK